jgi:hypothetical protein
LTIAGIVPVDNSGVFMRHVWSVLYALVLAPAVWILCAMGLTRVPGRAGGDGLTIEAAVGLALLMGAGAAYALLLLPRLSPVGPLVAGTALLGATAWAVLAGESFNTVWPESVARAGLDLRLPAPALTAFLAVPLIGTALASGRWRRRRSAAAPPSAPAGPFPALTAEQAMVPGDATMVIAPAAVADATEVIQQGEVTQVIAPPPDSEVTRRITIPQTPGDATVRIVPPAVRPDPSAGSGTSAPDPDHETTRRLQPVPVVAPGSPRLPEPPEPPQPPPAPKTPAAADDTDTDAR